MDVDKWGYFRPGYFPVQDNSIAPAMICLGQKEHHNGEPDVQFVLIKADCYLKIWEDALLVSETDFEEAQKNAPIPDLYSLMDKFMTRGYLPMKKIKPNVQFLGLH